MYENRSNWAWAQVTISTTLSTHVRESGFRNQRKILLVESGIGEFLLVESWIQVKESGIPLTIGIRYPSSTDKVRNPVPKIRNSRRRIQNPRLSWIPLHGSIPCNSKLMCKNSWGGSKQHQQIHASRHSNCRRSQATPDGRSWRGLFCRTCSNTTSTDSRGWSYAISISGGLEASPDDSVVEWLNGTVISNT